MSANGHDPESVAETVTGASPREEALELLDGAWNTRLAEAERQGSFGTEPETDQSALASTQLAAAQITALIYIGDQIGRLRDEIRDGLPYAGKADS